MPIIVACKRCGRKSKQIASITQVTKYLCYPCKRTLKEEAKIANAQDI